MEVLFVGIGGGFGAITRYFVIQLMKKLNLSSNFATICVNLVGSLLIGLLFHQLMNEITLHLILTTGFLGGFTTFSTFSFESFNLIFNKKYLQATSYIFANMFGGLILFIIGYSV